MAKQLTLFYMCFLKPSSFGMFGCSSKGVLGEKGSHNKDSHQSETKHLNSLMI